MKRGILLLLFFVFLLLVPEISSITGETITGEALQASTNVSVFVLPSFPIINIHSPENKTYSDTNIFFNYSIKNELASAWYNIDNSGNISLPNLTDNSFYLITNVGNHLLSLYANNSLGINSKSISFTVSQEQSSGSSASSGGGGGGGGGASISNFEIDKKLIEVSIVKGQSKSEFVEVKNNGNKAIEIKINSEGLEDFALIDETSFIFGAGETKQIEINFFSLTKRLPGIYVGKIIFRAGSVKKEVHVFIELKDNEALFDINVNILQKYKEMSAGDKISTLVDMTNIGLSGTAVDVELYLYIADLEKNQITLPSKEVIAVKTDLSVTRKISIPPELESGTYILIGEIKYQNLSASSYDTFEITAKKAHSKLWWILLFIALAFIILIIYLIFKEIRKRKIKKKKKN